MNKRNNVLWLDHLARYGLTPVELQPRDETGSALVGRLQQAVAATTEAEIRCEDDLRRARAGSEAVRRLLNDIIAAWAERPSPRLAAERAEVLQLVKALLRAIRSLRRKLAKATGGEVGDDDPIAAMALGEPIETPRDPDPIRTMAMGEA